MTARKTTALIILDGFGRRAESQDNAILAAATPFIDQLEKGVCAELKTSGLAVGLPDGQMGNSEVGHMNLGAGRVVYQDFTRITKAMNDGELLTNPAIDDAIQACKSADSTLHLMGLLSPGGVHSHQDHILAVAEGALAAGVRVRIHAFTDGRDTPPRSAEPSLADAERRLSAAGDGAIASIAGRYWAMDRDQRWDRVEKAYRAMVLGHAEHDAASAVQALNDAYARDENDEFVAPTLINGGAPFAAGDQVVFMNFRPDRAREMVQALTASEFDGFERGHAPIAVTSLTRYAASLDARVAFAPQSLDDTLGEWMQKLGKTQLRIAETEKYAHVTFFFSGGREQPYDGETRELIPSPNVATYDLQPEMSAPELTEKLCAAIRSGQHDLIICNYANGDMVGHTGNFAAAVKAIETLDDCVRQVANAINEVGGSALITADHGNAEMMRDPTSGQPHTAHTTGPVPLYVIGHPGPVRSGALEDVAPTLLAMMGVDKPGAMTGVSLI
ncbi:2,3-bisphosphoglycerate-independent phosphoglycerate mutase [Litorivicinus lipolyticus]|uniref:2,3-bisphosphoglycerate-independent phosphoglycerate mutase n=1 Tax=Litorivicinus lipolyticus TaxID=418701 RepID=UPI003B5A47B7